MIGDKKYLYLVLILLIEISLILFSIFYNTKISPIDCNEFGILYLTQNEMPYASGLADKINGIVYIPESNTIIGRTEILKCENTKLLDKFMFGDN